MEDVYLEYEGKIVLVTGGAGCIGTNLCRKLAELDARGIIMDDLSSAYEWKLNERLPKTIEWMKKETDLEKEND